VGYITIPIDTAPTDLADEAFSYIEEQVPGWLPSPGNLEAWLIDALAQLAGELRDLAALVPDSIFEYYGTSILNLPPYPAVSASGSTTWVAVDAAGYTVDAGTLVAVQPPASIEAYAFQVVADFDIPAGTTTYVGAQIQALEAGVTASGITGDVQMIDPLAFIASVTLNGATSGGTDAEATDDYLNRLSDLATLLTPRPILPQDFAILAQRSIAAIQRAVAIDLYDLATATANVPRCVTVVICDANGQPCDATTKSAALTLLQAQREVNFLVFVGDPTYTAVDVTWAATSYPGYDPTLVTTNVNTALAQYLNPASWGVPDFGDTSGRSWINVTSARYLEISNVINNTEGVHYVTSLQIAAHGGTLGTADVALSGVAPLAEAGTITGSCTPES
jgi:hypothetical protein